MTDMGGSEEAALQNDDCESLMWSSDKLVCGMS